MLFVFLCQAAHAFVAGAHGQHSKPALEAMAMGEWQTHHCLPDALHAEQLVVLRAVPLAWRDDLSQLRLVSYCVRATGLPVIAADYLAMSQFMRREHSLPVSVRSCSFARFHLINPSTFLTTRLILVRFETAMAFGSIRW